MPSLVCKVLQNAKIYVLQSSIILLCVWYLLKLLPVVSMLQVTANQYYLLFLALSMSYSC